MRPIFTWRPHGNSIAASGVNWAGLAIVLCLVTWVLGVILPVITVNRLYLLTSEHSIIGIVRVLVSDNEWLLAGVVGLFTIAAPFYKFYLLWRLWFGHDANSKQALRAAQQISWVSNWSMADVFVVAIIVVIFKTSGFFANASSGPGLYFFAASAIGSMIVGQVLKSRLTALRSAK